MFARLIARNRWTVYQADEQDEEQVRGWIWYGNCTNPNCKRQMDEGYMFHVCPKTGTLEQTHSDTLHNAITALSK